MTFPAYKKLNATVKIHPKSKNVTHIIQSSLQNYMQMNNPSHLSQKMKLRLICAPLMV